MTADVVLIERLPHDPREDDLDGLARLLVDAVDSGAAVSFLAPLTRDRAEAWWRRTFANADPRAVFLVARDGHGVIGTVQLHPAWAPNQPHRADIAKLIVDRRARGAGLGARLMQRAEDEARRAGFTLLTLDARAGTAAERLYRRLGWVCAGEIPRYALNADGSGYHATVIFYKSMTA